MKDLLAALQDWAIGIDRRTGSLKVLGIVLSVVLLAGAGIVLALFSGVFTNADMISVRLPASSTAVLPGSSVQFRDVSIGKVVGRARPQGDGSAVVDAQIDPGVLSKIPTSVRASVTPISVFGNQYVVLEPQSGADTVAGGSALRPGARIEAKADAPAVSVQQTVATLDRLLVALHPAELNAALTAVAQALQDQGQQLGQTANIASTYLAALQPLWPTVVENLGLLAPVAEQIAASSPDIVGILGNQLTTARTVNDDPELVHRLIVGSGQFAGQTEQLTTDIEKPFSLLAAASGPFLDAVSANPNTISGLLEGLDAFAKSVVSAGSSGPFLSTSATVDVRNPASLAAAALGGTPTEVLGNLAQGLGGQFVSPGTYGSADRPIFADRSTSAGRAAATSPSTSPSPATSPASILGPVVPPLPADEERAAVASIAAAIGGAEPRSADLAALLLSPLLASLGQPS